MEGVRLSTPDRVYYPAAGVTKLELAEYYAAVRDYILPHVAGRPLTLVRCPDGHQGECFFQKHVDARYPSFIHRLPIREAKTTRTYFTVDSIEGLIYLVQLGTLEFHVWGSRRDQVERPDRLIFDLDPGEGVSWQRVIDAARLVRDRLRDLELTSFVKTTGGKGLHVVAPLVRRQGWDELKLFAQRIAEETARTQPDRYTPTMAKDKRRGRIFIDYLRNARGATAVAAYSSRARAGAPVSMPLRWDELRADLRPDRFTIRTAATRLQKGDPWEGFDQVRQSITKKMKQEVGSH